LKLDLKDLVDILFDIDEKALFIPAHIWTPWFSLYGSRSGFDSIKDAFGEKIKFVTSVETGLSSDPK
jgi:DNA helicase II / ATP-dependent DNA helicase PcrA